MTTEKSNMLFEQDVLDQNANKSIERFMGPMFKNARLSDFSLSLREDVMKAIEAGRGLFITGLPGRGKTHLAAAVLGMVIKGIWSKNSQWKSVLYRHESDMLLEIRQAFSPGSGMTEYSMIDQLFYPDVLIIDDLGAAKVTEWTQQTFDTVIDRRYRFEKSTVITSNLSLSQVNKRISSRVASRLSAMCDVIELVGRDRRLTATR